MNARKIQFYTQSGLAAVAGLSRYAVSKAIERGTIRTVETIDGVPLVARRDAEKWLKDRPAVGRPRKVD